MNMPKKCFTNKCESVDKKRSLNHCYATKTIVCEMKTKLVCTNALFTV